MDKYIDKLIDNRWFMKVVALVLAMLLFDYVYDGQEETAVNVPQEQESETITEVPVKSYYDTDSLVVTGVPDTVTLTIQGPRVQIQQAKTQRNFEVYVDLSDVEIGTQRVPILIRDISDRLKVTIEPGFVNVSVQEKVTKEFNIEAEYNNSLLAAGYVAERPKVEPGKVKVTGAKDVIDRISYVKATVDIKGPVKDTISREANILVLDRDLNKLNVLVQPERVNVTIPIKASSKTVPIRLVQKGTLPNGVTIQSATLEKEEATIIGDEAVLNATESVRVELDVSSLNEDKVVTLPVIISEGIVEVNPQTIKVTVNINKIEDITFSNVPIKTEGLSEEYDVDFKDPTNGVTSLTITGPSNQINQIRESDINLFINLSNLGEGEHDVEVNVGGLDNQFDWKLAKETVRVSITEREEA